MASGNSWQVYQELGAMPDSVFEALKEFPQNTRRQRRRDRNLSAVTVFDEDEGVRTKLLKTPSSVANLCYFNDGFTSTSGKEDHGSTLERRRSFSPSRKQKLLPRRSSLSFRVQEKSRQLWNRAKTFLDVNVLATVVAAITPPLSPSSSSSSTNTGEFFTTASDLSKLRIDFSSDEEKDEYQDFPDLDMANMDEDNFDADIRRKHSNNSVHVLDPNCPIHGAGNSTEKRVSIAKRASSRIQRSTASDQRKINTIEIDTSTEPTPIQGRSRRKFGSVGAPLTAPIMLKLARRRHKASLTQNDRLRMQSEKSKIKRNLFTLSVAFLFLISAFQGLQNLQTTIHGDSGLGSISLCVVYFGLVISCLFTPPYLLNRIGCKLTLILSMSTYSVYILTHFSPKWYSLLPGSLLVGFGAAPLWAAKCTYLSEIGFRYAELNLESSNVVIVRFFGIFFMIVHLGQVFGNLISSWILRAAMGATVASVDSVDETCGHYFTDVGHSSKTAKSNLDRPHAAAVYSLCAVYFCCTILAAFIIAMFLSQLRRDIQIQREKPHFKLDIWNTTIQHLRKPRHLLLVPLTVFNGMQQAFMAGEFTKAYVGCSLGITTIGYVMTSFGMCDAVCSLVFGPLIKLFGRMPLLTFGAVVDMLMIFTLAVWPPNPADEVIFYVVAACWGMADGVWNTQINGLWVVIYADNLAAAFANYRLWESVGFIIAFSYTPFLTTETKLYVLLAMLYVGMLGYCLIEMWEPLEDYAIRLKDKLHWHHVFLNLSKSVRSRRGNTKPKRSKESKKDNEVTETLLTTAPLACEETDF